MDTYRELLLGCGRSRAKIIPTEGYRSGGGRGNEWRNLTTLDMDAGAKPDIVGRIVPAGILSHPFNNPFPDCLTREVCGYTSFKTDYFDEIHAYQVLEHLWDQGDYTAFFSIFTQFWNALKPGGLLCAISPSRFDEALWGDPGHRCAITRMLLTFLDQEQYTLQCDREKPTAMANYRDVYQADFRLLDATDDRKNFWFVLQAVKPSRIVRA